MTNDTPKRRVRQADIAEALGVSTVSVSNALAGRKGLSPELRDRIVQKAEEMGYGVPVPAPPRSRAPTATQQARQVHRFGVIFAADYSSEARYSFTDLAKTWPPAGSLAMDHLATIDIDGLSFDEAAEAVIARVRSDELDGLMTLGVFSQRWIDTVHDVLDIPWVCLDGALTVRGFDTLRTDAYRAGYALTEALLKGGHTRIGMLLDPPKNGLAIDLYEGYIKAYMDYDVTPPSDQVYYMKTLQTTPRLTRHDVTQVTELPDTAVRGTDRCTGWVVADATILNFLAHELGRLDAQYVPEVTLLSSANPSFRQDTSPAYRQIMTYVIDREQVLRTAVGLLRRRVRSQGRDPEERYFTGQSYREEGIYG